MNGLEEYGITDEIILECLKQANIEQRKIIDKYDSLTLQ